MGSTSLAAGQIVAGRYRVTSVLGEGGMGSVYLVQHVHTDEQLAMKVLHAQTLRDEDAVQRFRREARAPARIQSEHVARVTDADTAPELGGAPFYVMEYLRGKDLDVIIAENGGLPPGEALECLKQTARALDKAHQMGITHRDLKPENLFLTTREDGTPCIKLLDFGIAKIAAGELPAQQKTQSGAVFGTPAYMSPEQTKGEVDLIGPPSDIWAFGLIAYKLLTGKEYWRASVVAQLYVEILASPMPPPSARESTLGPAFDAWFAACVNRDISLRYPSAGEAVVALAAALGVEMGGRGSMVSLALDATQVDGGADASGRFRAADASGRFKTAEASGRHIVGAPGATSPPMATAHDTQSKPKSRSIGLFAVIGLLVVGGGIATFVALSRGGTSRVAAAPRATATAAPDHAATAAVAPSVIATTTGAVEPVVAPSVAAAPAPDDSATPQASAHPGWKQGPHGAKTKATAEEPAAAPQPVAAPAPAPEPAAPSTPHALTYDQRSRLDSLKRICDSGLATPAECAAKRAAIMRGP
ncbi:MAG TPA: serine/threonine-protein kinase [Byssovorax sp.]|jgi:serine/threonine-protein kinase